MSYNTVENIHYFYMLQGNQYYFQRQTSILLIIVKEGGKNIYPKLPSGGIKENEHGICYCIILHDQRNNNPRVTGL